MKIFTNCTVVLEFDLHTPFKLKTEWRKKITDNGGVVSYVLTRRSSFLVVFNSKTTSCAFKIRQSSRYNIPVVTPKYVETCLAKERLLKTESYRVPNVGHESGFKKGKIQDPTAKSKAVRRKRSRVYVNLAKQPSWLHGEADAPKFSETDFDLPKWALLISKDGSKLQVIEVHVQTGRSSGDNPKYRLFTQTAEVAERKVRKKEEAIVWHFETAAEVVSGYEQLYRRYSTPPMDLRMCSPGDIELTKFGSNKFMLVVGKLSLLNEKVSSQVAALTDSFWKEALQEVDSQLEVPMKHTQAKQVDEARVVLRQLGTRLSGGHGNDDEVVKALYKQFYEALPHRPEHRKENWSLQDVVARQDLCQLLSDIVTASEATDWSTDAAVIAKYRALGCHICHVDQSSDDFAKINGLVKESLKQDGMVNNVYTVKRTVEEVNFQADTGGVRLLMHASSAHNYLGILSRGLLLPNVVQDDCGVSRTDAGLLGCGIYFSDSARKSLQYANQFSQTGTRLLLLCDVALGRPFPVSQPDTSLKNPPEGYDSVQGVASTTEKPSFFMDNEFAVYDNSQQCLRYLVEVSLPQDSVKDRKARPDGQTEDMDTGEKTSAAETTPAPVVDIKDVKGCPDPLAKVKAGLQGRSKEPVPLKSVHVRARMMDMVAQVVVLQAYRNDNKKAIEAKYVFPLDETAAVCGFEAFINGKHIIGKCKEKAKARKEYKEAVASGHGAYLMEEETPEVFTVSVGNLPPHCDVLIKITYVTELQVDGDAICFYVPSSVAPWVRDGALAQKTQASTKTVSIGAGRSCEVTLQVAMEMASDIRRIYSPTHNVRFKNTATKAVVTLPKKCDLDNGFQLNVCLAEIHVPRMWVERHPDYNSQACMLTFFPEFETQSEVEPDLLILLDMSNSMKGSAEEDAKKVALLALDHLQPNSIFNVLVFGSTFKELFPSAQKCSKFSLEIARKFIQESTASLGSTDLWEPLHASHCLATHDGLPQNLFLISDGHFTQEATVVMETKSAARKHRVFTLGVGSTANHHLLRNLASVGGGLYQFYNRSTKSQWERKLKSQLEKISQPGLSEVTVDWVQTDNNALPPNQAPNQIPSLFSGCRQVVYGFVEGCVQATLKAKVQGQEVSTMVSTTELQITTGKMLHQLVARSVITDFENGVFDADRIKHQVLKVEKKDSIIELSKKYSIVTPYTSFVAVEERNEDDEVDDSAPSIEDLVDKETVDILPYIDWDPHPESEDKDCVVTVLRLLQKGEVAENFSMIQAEEAYCELQEYLAFIKENELLAEKVYDILGKYYSQNQSAVIGNILSEIEPVMKNITLRREVEWCENQQKKVRRSGTREILRTQMHLSDFIANLDPDTAIYDPKGRMSFDVMSSFRVLNAVDEALPVASNNLRGKGGKGLGKGGAKRHRKVASHWDEKPGAPRKQLATKAARKSAPIAEHISIPSDDEEEEEDDEEEEENCGFEDIAVDLSSNTQKPIEVGDGEDLEIVEVAADFEPLIESKQVQIATKAGRMSAPHTGMINLENDSDDLNDESGSHEFALRSDPVIYAEKPFKFSSDEVQSQKKGRVMNLSASPLLNSEHSCKEAVVAMDLMGCMDMDIVQDVESDKTLYAAEPFYATANLMDTSVDAGFQDQQLNLAFATTDTSTEPQAVQQSLPQLSCHRSSWDESSNYKEPAVAVNQLSQFMPEHNLSQSSQQVMQQQQSENTIFNWDLPPPILSGSEGPMTLPTTHAYVEPPDVPSSQSLCKVVACRKDPFQKEQDHDFMQNQLTSNMQGLSNEALGYAGISSGVKSFGSMPVSLAYSPVAPSYSPTSPVYQPTNVENELYQSKDRPGFRGRSRGGPRMARYSSRGGFSSGVNSFGSMPVSLAYCPISPSYSPTSPVYQPEKVGKETYQSKDRPGFRGRRRGGVVMVERSLGGGEGGGDLRRSRSISRDRGRSKSMSKNGRRSRSISRDRSRAIDRRWSRSISRDRRRSRLVLRGRSRSRSVSRDRRRSIDRRWTRSISRDRRRSRSISRDRRRSRSISRDRRRSRSISRYRRRSRSISRDRRRSRSISRYRRRSRSISRDRRRSRSISRDRRRSRSISRDRRRSRSISRNRIRARSSSRDRRSKSISRDRRSRSISRDRRRSRSKSRDRKRIRSTSRDRRRSRIQLLAENDYSLYMACSVANRRGAQSAERFDEEIQAAKREPEERVALMASSKNAERAISSIRESSLYGKNLVCHQRGATSDDHISVSSDTSSTSSSDSSSSASFKISSVKQKMVKKLSSLVGSSPSGSEDSSTSSSEIEVEENGGEKVGAVQKKTKLVRDSKTGRWERKLMDADTEKDKDVDTSERRLDFEYKKSTVLYSPRFVDENFIWRGVRNNRSTITHFARLDIEKLAEVSGSGPESKEHFWSLSPEVCKLLGVSQAAILEILTNQGVRSLGTSTQTILERVIATLLVIVAYIMHLYWKRNFKTFFFETTTSVKFEVIGENSAQVAIDDATFDLDEPFSSALLWLKSRNKQLPPLYKTLELGRSRMEFLYQLVKIFEDW